MNMKQKIFSLLVLLLTAVTGAWAEKEIVPSDAVLSDYYNPGDVCVCIYVPENTAPYGIVFTGSYNGWSTTASQCATFQAVTGYDGWYVTSFEPEAEPDEQKGMQGLPVRLDASGNVSMAYKAGAATAIRGGVQIEQGAYAGEINLINFGADAPNVIIIDQWNGELSAPTADGYTLSVGTNDHGTVKFYVAETEVTKAPEGATVTVVITPNTGWVVNQPSGQWGAAIAKAPRSAVPMLNGFELAKSTTAENTWSFTMERANAEVSVSYKKLLTNTDITVQDITALTYTGQAQEPVVTVKDGQTVLVKGTDYTVAYSNNTNAALATATENAPTVTITAVVTSEKYAGETTKKFTINKADITPTVPVAKTGLVYNEQAQALITAGTAEGGTMKYSLDDESYATTIPTGTNAKEYTVYYKVDADANHNDVAAQNFKVTITAATLTEATLKDTLFIFNPFGPKAQTAEVDVVKAGELIVPATDYTVSDDTQTYLGDYQLTVTGKNNFQGIVKANFHIVKDDLPVAAEDTESGEEVDNVTIQISVETDTETGDKTVIVDQLDVTPATSSQQVTVEIPSQINGVPVAGIAGGALVNATNVSDIYMPETGETAIEVTDGALEAGDGKAVIHAPIQLLDNYANMLPGHVGEKKVVSDVKQTAKRFWTFSCGVDVELPAGVTANIVKANNDTQVISEPINSNTVKANNGVLLEGEQGVEYQITALPASSVGNDYAGNLLEPVVSTHHYGYGQGYYILNGGMFYAIANEASAVGSCKAVLHIAGANARVISIVDETTGISGISGNSGQSGDLYDLSGRKIAQPTTKGIYVVNGKKVVVK